MPLTAYMNPEDENHRNWFHNFGFDDSDQILDNRADDYQGEQKLPVVAIRIEECSFQETVPEWINVLTGEEVGEQIVTINVVAHNGLYYFGTRTEMDNWITNTLNNFNDAVADPDGVQTHLSSNQLPSLPEWWENYEEK